MYLKCCLGLVSLFLLYCLLMQDLSSRTTLNFSSSGSVGMRMCVHTCAKLYTMSLFVTAESYSIVQMYHTFFIHSSVEGHLGCFQVLASMNAAAMNIVEQVSLWND